MIIAYAQAKDRQGIVAAMDGELVAPGEAKFIELREKAVSLNFSTTPHRVGDVEIRYGKGIVRLELSAADSGEVVLSPIVVVTAAAEVLEDRDGAVRRAIESVVAIGRQCDVQSIEAGFVIGERLCRSARTKRRVTTAVAVALIAVSIVWLMRGCSGSGDLYSSAGSWAIR